MTIDNLLRNIEQGFSFLFELHGFQAVYINTHHHQDRIGLELGNLKILFVKERGVDIKIGTSDLIFDSEKGWVNLKHLIDFVLQRPIEWSPLNLQGSYDTFLLESLSKTASDLKNLDRKIFEMFYDINNVNQWKPQFESYVQMEIKRRFGM